MYAYFSETLLYLCFAFVSGVVLLNMVPASAKPAVRVPGTLLFNAVIGIAVLSLVPVIKNTIFLTQFAGPFWEIIDDVLLDLEFGKAWIWMFVGCTLFLAMLTFRDINRSSVSNAIAAVLTLGLLFSYGWASHAAGQSESWGFLAQSFHLTAASVWIGVLLAAGWFADRSDNWLRFLRWFHPLAIACVLVIVGAGFVMMAYIVPDYTNSWIISYGQALLIKHLLFVPVLAFGVMNGFWMKRKLARNPMFDPRPWFRAESVLVTLIFAATAFMGMQRPPHDDPENPEPLVPSLLFRAIYGGDASVEMQVMPGIDPVSLVLAALSLGLLLLLFRCWSRSKPWQAACVGILFVVSAYLSIMLSIQ
ncbi:copper resistance D family protein [Paenibacillus hemerocallicola]|uniref:Copper resistance D family protein n=1 Tax=Paenibacillus hemerocallicola TaxID=1172614 RepID=A0A5C4TIU5_9BACL|nr:copper resistance D family protein [Paenibacillus hemerocallicola]TNJ68369.1 copper resistance D family protein [Paenibacillus hemerocallicola]